MEKSLKYYKENEYDNEHDCIEILKDELYVTTLNPIVLNRIIKFIQQRRSFAKKEIIRFSGKYLMGLPKTKKERIKYFTKIRESEFYEFNKLESICQSELNHKTKHLQKPLPKEEKEFTSSQVALIIHYKIKGKSISQPDNLTKPDFFKQIINKFGFNNSSNTVIQFFNLIGSERTTGNGSFYDPLNENNIEKIIPYLFNDAAAKGIAENDLYSYK